MGNETPTSTSFVVIVLLVGLAAAGSVPPAHVHVSILARLLEARRAHLLLVGCGAGH